MGKITRKRAEEIANKTYVLKIEGNKAIVLKDFDNNETKESYTKGDILEIINEPEIKEEKESKTKK